RRCEASFYFFCVRQGSARILCAAKGPRAQKRRLLGARGRQKGSPAERTGHAPLLIAAQYNEELPENNALFAIWIADYGQTNLSRHCAPRRDRRRARLPR